MLTVDAGGYPDTIITSGGAERGFAYLEQRQASLRFDTFLLPIDSSTELPLVRAS